jgi:hypothetical protein
MASPKDLSAPFTDSEVMDRVLACSLATLAAQLAAQSGQVVPRPLSQEQLARAFEMNTVEFLRLRRILQDDWQRRLDAGLISADD